MIMDCFSRIMVHEASSNLIKGFDVGNKLVGIHCLLFTDDTILFSPYNEPDITNLFNIFNIGHLFEEASRLNINHHKSVLW